MESIIWASLLAVSSEGSFVRASRKCHDKPLSGIYTVVAHPVVLLDFPVWSICVHLRTRCAVGKLEQAGEHAMVLWCVGKDGILEINAMRNDAVVFIHPVKKCNR